MSSYVSQKVQEKRKRLHNLEQQLSEIPRQIELLQAELSALEDVLNHEAKGPSRKAQSKPPKSKSVKSKRANGKNIPSKTGGPDGHWAALIQKYRLAGRSFSIDDVESDLKAIGQPNLRKSIRAKLVVLVNKGVLNRVSDGIFTVASEPRGVSGDELRAAGIIPKQARLVGEAA